MELSKEQMEQIIERLNSKEVTRTDLANELGTSGTTLTRLIKAAGYEYDNSAKMYRFVPENKRVQEGTPIQAKVKTRTQKSRTEKESEQTNDDLHKEAKAVQSGTSFTEEEINVLKQIIEEHKSNNELLEEFLVYKELSKVPENTEMVRSAFNLSKETTERLKKYAAERRLPLQDLVELAVINLLDKYQAKK